MISKPTLNNIEGVGKMPKVRVRSLRRLARICKPSILTGAITESADYIEELEKENEKLKRALTDISEIDYLSLPENRHFLKLQDAVVMAESMLDDLYNR